MEYPIFKKKTGLVVLVMLLISFNGFSQTSLDYYLKAARENNPTIKENLALGEKAGIQQNIINAEYQKPKVYATGNIYYPPLIPNKDDPNAVGYEAAITNGGLYSALLNVQQPLFNKSIRETLSEQAKISGESGVDKAKLTLHQLEKDVIDQYIVSYQSLNQMTFVNILKEQLIKQKVVVETFAANGIYKKSDILLIDIEIQNQATELNNLQAIYNRNIFALNDLCGLNRDANVQLSAPQIALKDDGAPSRFLEKFRLDSIQEVFNLQVTYLKYKPQVSIYGNTGLVAKELDGIQRKFGLGLGMTLAIPLYDGHQKDYTKQQSDINLRVINNYRQNFLVQKSNRQMAILSDLKILENKIDVVRLKLKNYERLIDLYKTELQTGELQIVNYMNTIRSYTIAQYDLTICETKRMMIINENNYYNW
jgi:outer membrane protein TolC